ncbi:hypothetical protein [Actinokineospora sp. HUAS TT18]|uniref:hypothetical protein n=1 Tax=Actinokineospora sp. HUAS TT18 TaxID=3447451 RepID=UPI003F522B0D
MEAPGFIDCVNPTPAEITAWAYRDSLEPMQDWQLIITTPAEAPTVMTLVADPACPTRGYLLLSLYEFARLAAHSDEDGWRPTLDALLLRSDSSTDPWITTWARRTRDHLLVTDQRERVAWPVDRFAATPVDPPR